MLRLTTTCVATAIFSLVGMAQSAHAEWEFSLSSDSDLTALSIGDIVTFDVVLSGVQPGEERIALFSYVDFESALLAPEAILPGSILPEPTGLTSDFYSAVPGHFGAFYDSDFTLSGERISSNGVFYSFQMEVIGAGSGEVAVFGNIPQSPVDGILGFTVAPAPSSLLLFGLGSVALLGCTRLRRNRSLAA